MSQRKISWSALFKALYQSKRLRTWSFLTLVTYTYLVKSGMGPIFSLLILAPSTYFAGLIFFFIIEAVIIPLYKWMTNEEL